MKHTWLKLLTSILWSRKFRSLPDNDHRMVYVGLLVVTKLGLENEPFRLLAPLLFVTEKRFRGIRKTLISVGLLTHDGKVNGFDDTQLTPEAARQKRKRERDKARDVTRDMSRESPPDSRKQRAEEEEEGDARVRAPARVTARPPRAEAKAGAMSPETEAASAACLRLVEAVRKVDPGANVPTSMNCPAWTRWMTAMLRLREPDGRSWQDINAAIDYAASSPFWAPNVIDPTRLRRHMTAITVELNARGRAASKPDRSGGKLGPLMSHVDAMVADDATVEAVESYIAGVPAEFRDRLAAHAARTRSRLEALVAESADALARAQEAQN